MALSIIAQVVELNNQLEIVVLLGFLDIIRVQVILVEDLCFQAIINSRYEGCVQSYTTN